MEDLVFAVTGNKRGIPAQTDMAKAWARELKVPYIERSDAKSLGEMLEENGLDALLVASGKGPRVFGASGTFMYHPGVGMIRWKRAQRGEKDHFLEAAGLKKGDRFLDCTMGLASDSLMASFAVGKEGRVVGLEASRLICFTVSRSLPLYSDGPKEMLEDLRRIEPVFAEAGEYLARLEKDSFDVIYFDPMFHVPVASSDGISALRQLACRKELDKKTVDLALLAAPKVVIKERSEKFLRSLGCTMVTGGRYSRVRYGIRVRDTE